MRRALEVWVVVAAAAAVVAGVRAQTIDWRFGTDAAVASPCADAVPNVSGGEVTAGNATAMGINASSVSSGYAGASGYNNASVSARPGTFNPEAGGSTYFEFALVPAPGCTLAATRLSVGMRSTASGPQAFCVRSSLDGYASDLASGTNAWDSAWSLKDLPLAATSTVAGAPVTFRLYGYGGTSAASGNWRIDDLMVAASAEGEAQATPPVVGAVAAQSVRVGQALTFALTVTATDGDPVTATNATASAGVTGAWRLADGEFSYAPSEGDVGLRTFTFTAADKDGASAPMAVEVAVLRAQCVAVRMTSAAGQYAQSFDALATNGADNAWDNAADPLQAWYAHAGASAATAYRTGTGSGTSGGLYAFGAAGCADRSLGSLASSGNGYLYGVAFTNETGRALRRLSVRFTAEQWRVGASALTNTLAFDVCVTNCVLPLNQGVWQRVDALCFDSPVQTNASQSAGAVYAASERSATVTCSVAPGGVVTLRWSDQDDAGNDHALAIDDLLVTWSAGSGGSRVLVK